MWTRAICLLIALGATADAKTFSTRAVQEERPAPATVQLGALGTAFAIDQLTVSVAASDVGATAHLTLHVSTTSPPEVRPGPLVLDAVLPAGASVTGAAIKLGNSKRMRASAWDASQARTELARVIEHGSDPLLVEQTDDETHVAIHVFPITQQASAVIELDVELPEIDRLAIESASTIGFTEANGHRYRAGDSVIVKLPIHRRVASIATSARRVDHLTSLYAGSAPSDRPLVVVCGCGLYFDPAHPHDTIDKGSVRRVMKRYKAQLARCYTQQYEFSGGPDATVNLAFSIGLEGTVESVSTSGDLSDERVTSCLTDLVKTFAFTPTDTRVDVNYPLHFHLD
ncbi:MAG TPA: AgmX/PglI C-terminal domain-containing protein [Kofleriaceae bacterium]|jgi:hypothetical protein